MHYVIFYRVGDLIPKYSIDIIMIITWIQSTVVISNSIIIGDILSFMQIH